MTKKNIYMVQVFKRWRTKGLPIGF